MYNQEGEFILVMALLENKSLGLKVWDWIESIVSKVLVSCFSKGLQLLVKMLLKRSNSKLICEHLDSNSEYFRPYWDSSERRNQVLALLIVSV